MWGGIGFNHTGRTWPRRGNGGGGSNAFFIYLYTRDLICVERTVGTESEIVYGDLGRSSPLLFLYFVLLCLFCCVMSWDDWDAVVPLIVIMIL